jgi:hypothetical protein
MPPLGCAMTRLRGCDAAGHPATEDGAVRAVVGAGDGEEDRRALWRRPSRQRSPAWRPCCGALGWRRACRRRRWLSYISAHTSECCGCPRLPTAHTTGSEGMAPSSGGLVVPDNGSGQAASLAYRVGPPSRCRSHPASPSSPGAAPPTTNATLTLTLTLRPRRRTVPEAPAAARRRPPPGANELTATRVRYAEVRWGRSRPRRRRGRITEAWWHAPRGRRAGRGPAELGRRAGSSEAAP